MILLPFAVFFSIISSATCDSRYRPRPHRQTNADRFRAGLPPLPPVKLQRPSASHDLLADAWYPEKCYGDPMCCSDVDVLANFPGDERAWLKGLANGQDIVSDGQLASMNCRLRGLQDKCPGNQYRACCYLHSIGSSELDIVMASNCHIQT